MRSRTWFVAPVAALVVGLAACQGDDASDRAGRFCAEVKADQPTITAAITDPAAVDGVVETFRDLEQTAPLAIEDDWTVLTQLVESAAAIDPSDNEARERFITAAYEAGRSVENVVGWVRAVCGVDLTVPLTVPPSTLPSTLPSTVPATNVPPDTAPPAAG